MYTAHIYWKEIFTELFIWQLYKSNSIHILLVVKWKTSFSWFHIQDMVTNVFGRHGYWHGVNVSYIIYRVNFHSMILLQHISYKDNTYNVNWKSIQIDLKWLFWDKVESILNWFKHTEDKMVKLKVLLVRRIMIHEVIIKRIFHTLGEHDTRVYESALDYW